MRDETRSKVAGSGALTGSTAEMLIRAYVADAAGFYSVIVAIYGFIVGGAGPIALGLVVGLATFALAFVADRRPWSRWLSWAALLVAFVANSVAIVVMGRP